MPSGLATTDTTTPDIIVAPAVHEQLSTPTILEPNMLSAVMGLYANPSEGKSYSFEFL